MLTNRANVQLIRSPAPYVPPYEATTVEAPWRRYQFPRLQIPRPQPGARFRLPGARLFPPITYQRPRAGGYRFISGLGQTADAGSYAAVWEFLKAECEKRLGKEGCNKLLGYRPFVCEPEHDDRVKWWVWLVGGIIIGKVIL